MDKPIIEVKNLGKKYDINRAKGGYIALRDVLANIARAPFSFLKTKAQEAVGLKKKEEFWALKDVSFAIKKGEVVGVIGANGAGKSTLLKILSQITPPTEGEIILRGRVGSLLEVGTGFHPELSGRENIFLNGAILGMKKKEIEKKFDQIVEFAGIEKFLDTPVKYYSSGMYVRLAFSVAAHMEPDILLVDEVLAVGDAEFQKKCLGKMDEITKNEGRTILFVSHNMGAIQKLCEKSILLNQGEIVGFENTDQIIAKYALQTKDKSKESLEMRKDRKGSGELVVENLCILNSRNEVSDYITCGESMDMVFEYTCDKKTNLSNVAIAANISDINGISVFLCHSEMTGSNFTKINSKGKFVCHIPRVPLVPGTYNISFRITSDGYPLDYVTNAKTFDVVEGDFFGTGGSIKRHSLVYVDHTWENK